jgi:hypothetical protein
VIEKDLLREVFFCPGITQLRTCKPNQKGGRELAPDSSGSVDTGAD